MKVKYFRSITLGAVTAAIITTSLIWLSKSEIVDSETISNQTSTTNNQASPTDKKSNSIAPETTPKTIEPIVHESPKDGSEVLPVVSSRLIEPEDLIPHPDSELMTEQGDINEQTSSIYEEYTDEEIHNAGFSSLTEFENYWRNTLSIEDGVKFSIVKKTVNGEKVMTFVMDGDFPVGKEKKPL